MVTSGRLIRHAPVQEQMASVLSYRDGKALQNSYKIDIAQATAALSAERSAARRQLEARMVLQVRGHIIGHARNNM